MESLLFASFVAGFLTVLAPCLLPLLPVVIGGSLVGGNKRNPYIIIGSLLLSVVLFTLIIEGLSLLFYIPPYIWSYIAATLVLLVGLSFLAPSLWTNLPFIRKLANKSNTTLGKGTQRKGILGDVTIGASLGPAFSSCSPTFLIILAIVLPRGFFEGLLYLIVYALGLGVVLLFIALLGQKAIEKLNIFADGGGWFKKIMGIIMIIIAIMIYAGFDKTVGSLLLDIGLFDTTQLELMVQP